MFKTFSAISAPVALSVSAVNRQVKQLLESDPILEDLSVEGEISNLSRPASGHIYFTLKDAASALKCVMWKTAAARYQNVFKEGASIIATGRIGVYEPSGVYQLYAEKAEKVGAGKRYEEFLALKEKLDREGLFAPERKRPLPRFPRTIGIVTSSGGAALQDILKTLEKRRCTARVLLSPSSVQGIEAPAELVAAFRRLVTCRPDVILIGRGGGSAEDLWAFNDETLVRVIASSPIPVISGIGHEIDFTLVDFAADFRAPTPTAAAVSATADGNELLLTLDRSVERMRRRCEGTLREDLDALTALRSRLSRTSPEAVLARRTETLDALRNRLDLQARQRTADAGNRLTALRLQLDALSPTAVLKRGYAIVTDSEERPIARQRQLTADQSVRLIFQDGVREARITD
ncbi:exodeoxyribonuclease VII large subunit [Anaerolineaceae bacterium oral taxon 439]|nr:exodeoxyribonuclease VII large subunit [Anaerolineaceae bacterium oral taxon 439]